MFTKKAIQVIKFKKVIMQFTKKEVLYIFVFFAVVSFVSYVYVSKVLASSTRVEYVNATQNNENRIPGYNLGQPIKQIELPKALLEVSGLTDIDNSTVACVQDEDGIAYIYDLEKQEIINEFEFDKEGDYEGISRVGNSLYILRSDGKLFEVDDYNSKDFKVEEYELDIPVKDNEGLAYDAQNNRLLIAGKSEPKGDEYEDKRVVFAFDLGTKKLLEQPVYIFSKAQIEQFVELNKSNLSAEVKESTPKIHPSGIAIHPISDKLFVLSSKDKLLYIFNRESQIEGVFHLNKKMFKQAEGITFLANGDMMISNEGGKKEPTLLFFSFEP